VPSGTILIFTLAFHALMIPADASINTYSNIDITTTADSSLSGTTYTSPTFFNSGNHILFAVTGPLAANTERHGVMGTA